MQQHKRTPVYTEERFWFYVSLCFLCTVFAAYIYFLSASVVHVVIRKEIDHEIALLGSRISELESEYIAAQHAVSEDVARMHGFKIAEEKTYIDRTETSLVLNDRPGS